MCRWVAYVGAKVLLADIIVKSQPRLPDTRALFTQLHHTMDRLEHGWYNLDVDPEPCIFTSIAPAEHNVNLARLCNKIQSHLIFGHVCAASLGSSVNDTNCHPFQFGRYLWMHNGCVGNWSTVKRPVTALLSSCSFAHISGTTDSEVCGALFVDQLPSHNPLVEHSPQDMIDAMNRTIQILTQFAHALHVPDSGESPCSSLNFAVSDGQTIVATRFRDSITDEPPSLYYCKVTHMEMVGNEMEIHHDPKSATLGVVIASEPLTYQSENWTLIPKNHMIVVTNGTDVQLLPITLTSERLTSRWISDASAAGHRDIHTRAAELNNFFGTPCCPELPLAEPTPKQNPQQAPVSASAPASPYPSRRPEDNQPATLLESPGMAGALRALLASATPSQLREILESNLLSPSDLQPTEIPATDSPAQVGCPTCNETGTDPTHHDSLACLASSLSRRSGLIARPISANDEILSERSVLRASLPSQEPLLRSSISQEPLPHFSPSRDPLRASSVLPILRPASIAGQLSAMGLHLHNLHRLSCIEAIHPLYSNLMAHTRLEVVKCHSPYPFP